MTTFIKHKGVRKSRERIFCPNCEGEGKLLQYDPVQKEHYKPCPLCEGAMFLQVTTTIKTEPYKHKEK